MVANVAYKGRHYTQGNWEFAERGNTKRETDYKKGMSGYHTLVTKLLRPFEVFQAI